MLTIFIILTFSTILTIIITVAVWSYFNKEDKQVIQLTNLLRDIRVDISQLAKSVIAMYNLISEVSRLVFRQVQVIDVDSKEVKEEKAARNHQE